MTNKTIALHASLEDPDTGAPVTHFVVAQYTVRTLNSPGCQALLQGYVSQSAYETGKRALSHIAVEIPTGVPEGVDALQWLYEQVPLAEGALFGAVPVNAAEGI
ncbi:hypothetical protein [Pantoea sp. 18069]|uniref:hypothetical protein n=1 Tax=Pantoea sp. 18069 TaxID=2681415 RepID=UPI00135C64B2|nr:hypothetical protein [Pantoea sp. 18069]